MFKNLFKRLSGTRIEETEGINNEKMVNIRTDEFVSVEGSLALIELIADKSNTPIFKGIVKHIYESDFTGYKDKCPLCGSPTERMISSFGYATQDLPRLATAPTGLFCSKCPTVIIDDDMMKNQVVSRPHKYYGVFSVETNDIQFHPIATINGKTPTYIFNDDRTEVCGFYESVHQPEDQLLVDKSGKFIGNTFGVLQNSGVNRYPDDVINSLRKKKEKEKAKKALAKKSKKANRK